MAIVNVVYFIQKTLKTLPLLRLLNKLIRLDSRIRIIFMR